MRSSIVFGGSSILAIAVLGAASGCPTGGEGQECDPLASENQCPPGDDFAQFCSAPDGNVCVNVCEGANILGGDSCERDGNCDSPLTCDNDRVAVSSCECVLACPSVGADPGSVQAGGACSQTVDCAEGLTCDNEMVGVSSCTCMGETSGCDAIFGGVSGYIACAETANSCRFYAVLNESNCTALCAEFEATCLDSFPDLDNDCRVNEEQQQQDPGECGDVVGDRICVCSKP